MLGNGGLLGASADENRQAEVDAQQPAATRLLQINNAQANYLGVGTSSRGGAASTGSVARRVYGNPNLRFKLGDNSQD